jgi:hypothetical protein
VVERFIARKKLVELSQRDNETFLSKGIRFFVVSRFIGRPGPLA